MSKQEQKGIGHHSFRPAGEMFVWLCAMGLTAGLLMVLGLLGVIVYNGVSVFWPRDIYKVELVQGHSYQGKTEFAGAVVETRDKAVGHNADGSRAREYKFFVGNKETYGNMFRYIDVKAVASMQKAEGLMVAERLEGGKAVFYPKELTLADGSVLTHEAPSFDRVLDGLLEESQERRARIRKLTRSEIGSINHKLEKIRLELNYLEGDAENSRTAARVATLEEKRTQLQTAYGKLEVQVGQLQRRQQADKLTYILPTGEVRSIDVGDLIYVYEPNNFGFFDKIGFFFKQIWQFLSEDPRDANTEGGVFPAIFGTFVMTVLMSAAVMPFGVLAAIYLREYASQGLFTQCVRIAVNNLAGVPSIVYGVFGLGFFVYGMGSTIDQLFFSANLPSPTFGTGGVLWASLTLALLTVPVVVVATEEALAAVPRGMREASLACGASKWQTIQRIVMPASASGILTGLILAMARGAGEVAPLMMVGVVKYARDLPIDGTFPYLHLERKFMHLGFSIYDLGFQSPDSEAAKPMVFATTLLLIILVILLNLGAILIRDHLRKKYASGTF